MNMIRACAVALGTASAVLTWIESAHADTPRPAAYETASSGTRLLASARSGLTIKLLVESANAGGDEVEVGEITFPAGYDSSGHTHGVLEIFYVLEGELQHIVNGEAARLTPGMVGIVRAGDTVTHRVDGDRSCRALVIWAPGGEAERLAPYFEQRPIEN